MAHRIPVILMGALVSAASAFAQPAAPPPLITEELICERPEKDAGRLFRALDHVSSDLGKVVWILRRDVVVNGETVPPPADEFIEPALSPDGQHVLRAGRQAKSWFVWLDTQQIAGPFDGVRRTYFAPDGRVVFAAKRAQAWTWFVDGKEQPVTTPVLKQDGALCKTELAGLWNIDHPTTREVLEHCWSALIAVARDRVAHPTKRIDGWHMVVDGQIGPPFESIIQTTFSPDGSRLAYLGIRKDRVIAVVDGKEEPARDAVEGLRFSADSRRVAYLAIDTSKDVTGLVVADGAPSRSYPALIQNADRDLRANLSLVDIGLWISPELQPYMTGASAPLFRSDGKVVYAARTAAALRRIVLEGGGLEMVPGIAKATGQEGIWVEGADKPLFQASLVLSGPVLSDVGEHVGWVEWDAKAETWVGFVDGQPRGTAPSVPRRSNSAEHLTLSRDGSRLAFVQVAGGGGSSQLDVHALHRVVATGLEDKPYDAIGLTNLRFSDDGKHLAYEVHGAKGLAVRGRGYAGLVVLDGVPGRVYSEVMSGTMRFVGPNAVRYVARVQETKGGPYRYYRVTQTAP
jgi:WD40-like Beta Propeller Repeat